MAQQPRRRTANTNSSRRRTADDIRQTENQLATIGVVGNVALTMFKMACGVIGNSAAMITDAIHSLSDVLATAVAFVGSKLAHRSADESHPYGHERFECLAALILAGILLLTGAGLGYQGVINLLSGEATSENLSWVALLGAVVSIGVKEAMYRYTMHHAKRIKSEAFKADAWHHRSDALSSVGALIGIIAGLCGVAWADGLASLVICLFILKVSFEVAADAVNNMMDVPCDAVLFDQIYACIDGSEGVIRIDELRTRKFGNRIYVDAEIAVRGSLTLYEAHEIAHKVHDKVEDEFPDIKHIMIHENPA